MCAHTTPAVNWQHLFLHRAVSLPPVYINSISISHGPLSSSFWALTTTILDCTMAYYCVRCEQSFQNNRALQQHKNGSDAHWICYDCNIDFGSFEAQREHYITSRYHHYCRICDRLFKFEESRIQHMESKHWYCRTHHRVSIPSCLLVDVCQ